MKKMIRTYVVSPENFLEDRIGPILAVDVFTNGKDEPFDEEHCKAQAAILKEKSGAAAVVLQHSGKFWVI